LLLKENEISEFGIDYEEDQFNSALDEFLQVRFVLDVINA